MVVKVTNKVTNVERVYRINEDEFIKLFANVDINVYDVVVESIS